MQLAVSNIAWEDPFDSGILNCLHDFGIKNIEIAPSKHWAHPSAVNEIDAKLILEKYKNLGFRLSSMQSLLYGQAQLSIFNNTIETSNYLKNIIDLASWLEIRFLVFGSPKNRVRGQLSLPEALKRAKEFFKPLGEYAFENNVSICLEANSKQYGCDFINTSDEAAELVEMTKSEGFCLHLDVGNMVLEHEDLYSQFAKLLPTAKNIQISAPRLEPIFHLDSENVPYILINNFNGFVSIEMLSSSPALAEQQINESLSFITKKLSVFKE